MKKMPLLFFIKQLGVHRKALALGVLLSLILALSSIALLALSGWFISAAAFAGLTVTTATVFNYLVPAGMVRFLSLTRILSRYADRIINHDYTFKILTQLRVWFYQKLIPLSPARLLSERSGDLLNRLVNDIDTLDHFYLNVLSPFLINILVIMISTLLIAHFSTSIAIINLAIMLISISLISFISLKKATRIGKQIQRAQSTLRIKVVDTLQSFVDLLLFEKKQTRDSQLDKPHNDLMTHQQQLAKLTGFINSIMLLASSISVFSTLLIGIPLVYQNQLNGAILAMIVLLILVLFEQLASLPMAALALGKTKESAYRLLAIADQTPIVTYPQHSDVIDHHSIAFNNITFFYSNEAVPIFNHFSLEIKSYEKIAITSPSGTGKTTLLNLAARIYDPQSGTILLGDTNLKHVSENDLRQCIAYVTQQVHIFNASVRDNIRLFQTDITDDQIWHWLEKMDLANTIFSLPDQLDTLTGEFGKHFSGGQIRRIAMARAFIANTPILLMDEPSTGLDDALTHRIWQNCEAELKNKTLVVATHDPILLETLNCFQL